MSDKELRFDTMYEYATKLDFLRFMFPESIYGPGVPQFPKPPHWRQQTWIPILDPLSALYCASSIFELTNNRVWELACYLLLWNDEIESGWEHWSYDTAFCMFVQLHKAGAVGASILASRLIPLVEAMHNEDVGEIGEQTLEAFKRYMEEVVPTAAKFFHFDPQTMKCLRDFLGQEQFERFLRQNSGNFSSTGSESNGVNRK